MTGKSKKNLKIIGATGMAIFSLTAVFTAVMAWFTLANNEVSASSLVIKALPTSTAFSKLTIHRCILNQSSSSKYVFDENPIFEYNPSEQTETISEPEVLEVLDYSELNSTQPVLLLFHLSDDDPDDEENGYTASDVCLTAKTAIAEYVSVITNAANDPGYVKKFPFSHCVKFQSIDCTLDDFPFNGVLTSGANGLSEQMSFVTFDGNEMDYTNSLTLYKGADNDERKLTYIGIVMDYYEDAISYLVDIQNETSTNVINDNGRIGFYCDWVMEL